MALTKIKTSGIADDAVTTDKLANAINTERTANTAKVSTTINNNADNKIITGSGTANTLEAESLAYVASDGDLWIGHAPTTHYDNRKMFIHQPTAGETAYLSITGEQGAGIVFGDSVGQNTGNYESLIWHNNSDDSLKIATDNGDKGIKIENGGDVEVIDGNVKFASGHGIDFSATSDYTGAGSGTPSELLDDYEEGTFTPRFQTSNGNWGGSMSSQDGSYTKIGNVVHVRFRLFWGSVSGSGNFRITALPFTVANTNSNQGGPVIGVRSGFNYERLTSYFLINSQQLQFQFIDASAPYGSFDLSAGALASTGHVYCSGWYETA